MHSPSSGDTGVLRPGLCSVTLRSASVEEVALAATQAGLSAIEWGGDIHCPPVVDVARGVAAVSARRGLAVSSYGSYYRAGSGESASSVVAAASALGAPRIRVWPGEYGSAEATTEYRARVVSDLVAVSDLAATAGITVGLEFHDGSLTDTVESTERLLDEVNRDNLLTYWQAPIDVSTDDALRGLTRLLPRVCALHVFSWGPGIQRQALRERADLWREVLGMVREQSRPMDALIEFVADDSVDNLIRDSQYLREELGA